MSNLWSTKTLGELCEKPQYGFTASASLDAMGPRFLRITDLRNGTLDWNSVPFCACSDDDREKYRLKTGDIVVARIGATTGKTSLVISPPDAVFASYLIRFRAKDALNPFFLFFFTQSEDYRAWIDGNKGNNLKGGVNASLLEQIEVTLPPRPEQEKIAAVLWKIQRAIETEEKLIATARELKQSAMHQLYTEGLRGEPLKEAEIGAVLGSWTVGTLEDLCDLRKEVCEPENAKTKVYVGLEHIDGGLTRLTRFGNPSQVVSSKNRFYPNDILYGKLRSYLDKAVVAETEGICSTDILVFIPKSSVPPDFLVNLIHTREFIDYADRTTHGVNHPRTSWVGLKDFRCAIPSQAEREEIAKILLAIDKKLSIHERKRVTLQELFKTMLHKLMTAKIRVNDLDIDTTEVTS